MPVGVKQPSEEAVAEPAKEEASGSSVVMKKVEQEHADIVNKY